MGASSPQYLRGDETILSPSVGGKLALAACEAVIMGQRGGGKTVVQEGEGVLVRRVALRRLQVKHCDAP